LELLLDPSSSTVCDLILNFDEMNTESVYVYFEKQESALCGVHCLNALLQGPFFTEIDLMVFGKELDESERTMMGENGYDTNDYLKFMQEDSGNVADNGNFSIQVLTKALHAKLLDLVLITEKNFPEIITNLDNENAFICHQGSHWYSIRKVNGDWYNLNSTLFNPKALTPFELSQILDEHLTKNGYHAYLVHGRLPPIPIDRSCSSDGQWIKMKGGEDADVEAAIKISLEMSKQAEVKPDKQLYPTSTKSLYPAMASIPEKSLYPTTSDEKVSDVDSQSKNVHQSFEKVLQMMTNLESKLAGLEATTASILKEQKKEVTSKTNQNYPKLDLSPQQLIQQEVQSLKNNSSSDSHSSLYPSTATTGSSSLYPSTIY